MTDCILTGEAIDVDTYKVDADEYKLTAEIDSQQKEVDRISVDKQDKFSYEKWIKWEELVYTYFDSQRNSKRIPLSYVIGKALPTGTVMTTLNRDE